MMMTNAEWLRWFDSQSHQLQHDIMNAIDSLERIGIPGRMAHATVMIAAKNGVAPARISAVMADNVVKH
jgi:hypothetical protein